MLGGSSVTEVAHYQILITWLIATCSFLSMIATVFVLYRVAFNAGTHVLRTDRFTEVRKGRGKMGWKAFAGALCGNAFAFCRWRWGWKGKRGKGFQSLPNNDGSNDNGMEVENASSDAVFENRIRIQTRRLSGDTSNDTPPFFRVTKFQFSVLPRAPSSSSLWSLSTKGSGSNPQRPEAEPPVALPGRSLTGHGSGDDGNKDEGNGNGGNGMVWWRTAVQYTTQHKVDLPGTPPEVRAVRGVVPRRRLRGPLRGRDACADAGVLGAVGRVA